MARERNNVHNFIITTALNLGLGALLGAAGGLLGIGGGLIAIPVLGYLYGMDQHLAQGTALVMIAPNVFVAFLRYHQRHRIDLRAVAVVGAFAVASTWVAARFAIGVGAARLHEAFAVFLVLLALYFAYLAKRPPAAEAGATAPGGAKVSPFAMPILGIVSGGMSGVFTVGGGLAVVPALVGWFGMTQTRAQGMALALVVPGSLVSLAAYAQVGKVAWATGLPMALGGMATVSWGVLLAHRWPAAHLRILFCVVLLGTAAAMLHSAS